MKKPVKKTRNQISPLIIAGILVIVLSVIILSLILFTNNRGAIIQNSDVGTQADCTIHLKIQEINPDFNILKIKRESGEGELYQVRVFINDKEEDLFVIDLDEGEEKQFLLNIDSGDEVKIASILKDGNVCSVSDERVA